MSKIDGVLGNVGLGVEIGSDIHRRVGDDERLFTAGHVHDEAMADPALGADAAFPGDDGAHELVGVEAALHQGFDLACRDQPDCLRR
jgi:hypothetical protein